MCKEEKWGGREGGREDEREEKSKESKKKAKSTKRNASICVSVEACGCFCSLLRVSTSYALI